MVFFYVPYLHILSRSHPSKHAHSSPPWALVGCVWDSMGRTNLHSPQSSHTRIFSWDASPRPIYFSHMGPFYIKLRVALRWMCSNPPHAGPLWYALCQPNGCLHWCINCVYFCGQTYCGIRPKIPTVDLWVCAHMGKPVVQQSYISHLDRNTIL